MSRIANVLRTNVTTHSVAGNAKSERSGQNKAKGGEQIRTNNHWEAIMRYFIALIFFSIHVTVMAANQAKPLDLIFAGTLNHNIPISMSLHIYNGFINGWYIYNKVSGSYFDVNGTLQADHSIKLQESIGQEQTGSLIGVLKQQDGQYSISGFWQHKNKNLPFELVEKTYQVGDAKLVAIQDDSEKNDPRYKIYISYPQLDSTNLTPAATKFNELVFQKIKSEKAAFLKGLTSNKDAPPGFDKVYSTLQVDYDVMQANANLISVRFLFSSYYIGQAHPNSFYISFNYAMKDQGEISLSQLFKAKNYLQKIARFSKISLLKQQPGTDQKWITDGSAATAKNYQTWNLLPNGLLVTFNAYQVGPYVLGAPKVNVPLRNLKLKPQYQITK